LKALIVDPDPAAAEVVRMVLEELGGQVVVVRTGAAALRVAREPGADFDLVVLELELPDMDGLVACRRLCMVLAGVPVVVCHKRDDDDAVVQAFGAGAHDVVHKPIRRTELGARLRAALGIRDERRRREAHDRRVVAWARQIEKSRRDLESTACTDPLTGIANRRHFDSLLCEEWRRAARDHVPFSLVFFDLDEFHVFNERYGHVSGDACLAKVARTMAHELRRASDVLARYGGEELVAVLPGTDVRGACIVAERMRARIEGLRLPHAGSRAGVVTMSAGVATRTPKIGLTAEVLLEGADAALFRAKREGRNRCCADGFDAGPVVGSTQPWPACPTVIVDPILAQRVPRFLDALRMELCALEVGEASVNSVLTCIRLYHESFGFNELADLATRVDEAAGRSDLAVLKAAVRDLAWYVDHVQVVYRRPALRAV
jgi:diguanylate cyclase (GGDEF)-like protein